MLCRPALVLFSSAALTAALAPASPEITAAPAEPAAGLEPTRLDLSGLPYSLSCWCETIPYLTTTFCLPCSTVYFTTDFTTTATVATATTTD
ncbi:hypothetical protein K438DRAFT_2016250 [Mycena galopus ATCC 62051]|nr:hypothetical protein K438DRAFT_2016250 [Mycena galopus ATCC 62051]